MRFLLVFLIGVTVGAVAMHYYRDQEAAAAAQSPHSTAATAGRDATDRALARTRAVASDVSDSIGEKMKEWRLTPADIRAELSKSGEIVRKNAALARDRVSDARIITVIKAKFVLDRDLSANAVEVACQDGNVTLSGALATENLVGKAVAHALDTDGVQNVKSKIVVRSSE